MDWKQGTSHWDMGTIWNLLTVVLVGYQGLCIIVCVTLVSCIW